MSQRQDAQNWYYKLPTTLALAATAATQKRALQVDTDCTSSCRETKIRTAARSPGCDYALPAPTASTTGRVATSEKLHRAIRYSTTIPTHSRTTYKRATTRNRKLQSTNDRYSTAMATKGNSYPRPYSPAPPYLQVPPPPFEDGRSAAGELACGPLRRYA